MILIADSGSTKTDWAIVSGTCQPVVIHTQGINPVHQSRDEIIQILCEEFMDSVPSNLEAKGLPSLLPSAVYFYGSGVRPELKPQMNALLRDFFPKATEVEAYSDLLGAAHALCGCHEGIACILGTGANSCLYDGKEIVQHTPALGYILGDEGSGAALGKRFVHDLYCGKLSGKLKSTFEKETGLTLPDIINRVYRKPLANRFLASLSEFVGRHLDDRDLREVVINNFIDFLNVHILPYQRPDLPVSFVGSIAWYYQKELREAAAVVHCQIGTVLKTPLINLVRYHQVV